MVIKFTNIPKIIIETGSPINELLRYLQKEYLKYGRNPIEGTIALEELFNGDPKRITREFRVPLDNPNYLRNIMLGQLHENIKLGLAEKYCEEVLDKIKTRLYEGDDEE